MDFFPPSSGFFLEQHIFVSVYICLENTTKFTSIGKRVKWKLDIVWVRSRERIHCVRCINPCLLSDFSYRFRRGIYPRFSLTSYFLFVKNVNKCRSRRFTKLRFQRMNSVLRRKILRRKREREGERENSYFVRFYWVHELFVQVAIGRSFREILFQNSPRLRNSIWIYFWCANNHEQ